MKTQKLMVVLASAGLALGLAGCAGNADASVPTYKVPTMAQMDKEKQVLNAEHKDKAAKEYAAKVKAEKEAKAKAEAEAAAAAQAQAQAGGQASSGGNYQPRARSGSNYQGLSNYRAPRRSGGNYQAPRRSGTKSKAGNSGEWRVGESRDYKEDSSRWTYKGNGNYEVSGCGDSEGNTWAC